jgi:uncharacterized protein (TIGR02391 family)
MQICDIKDPEVFIALKRICDFIIDIPWHTSGDADYDYAVAKSKAYAKEIEILAGMDIGTAWGQIRYKTQNGHTVSKHAGDLNPWYEGDLSLESLISSLELVYDIYSMSEPVYLNELEFVHYFDFLSNKVSPHAKQQNGVISLSNLHSKIREHCEGLYLDEHYSSAILEAYKVVFNELKLLAGIYDLDGKPLAEKALSLSNPLIKLNELKTQSDKDEQLGFMMLFSGAATGIRNPKAHDLINQSDELRALQYLSFASLLLTRLDERLA